MAYRGKYTGAEVDSLLDKAGEIDEFQEVTAAAIAALNDKIGEGGGGESNDYTIAFDEPFYLADPDDYTMTPINIGIPELDGKLIKSYQSQANKDQNPLCVVFWGDEDEALQQIADISTSWYGNHLTKDELVAMFPIFKANADYSKTKKSLEDIRLNIVENMFYPTLVLNPDDEEEYANIIDFLRYMLTFISADEVIDVLGLVFVDGMLFGASCQRIRSVMEMHAQDLHISYDTVSFMQFGYANFSGRHGYIFMTDKFFLFTNK